MKYLDEIFDKIDSQKYTEYNLCGLTSPKSQYFLHEVSKGKNVLEIGYFKGASTIPIALSAKSVTAIDSLIFTETIPVLDIDIGDTTQTLENNLKKYKITNTKIINADIFSPEVYGALRSQKFDVIFYDASHEVEDIFKFLVLYEKILNNAILILDDYNFESVQTAIDYFINTLNKKIVYKKEIFTESESKNDYWNGLGVFILK